MPEEIKDSFQPYNETTALSEETDQNMLYDLQAEIEQYEVLSEDEVQKVNELEVTCNPKKSTKLQQQLNAESGKGVKCFKQLSDEEKESFK